MPGLGGKFLPAVMVALSASSAVAQQKSAAPAAAAKPSCDVDEGTPSQLARALISLTTAQQSLLAAPATAAPKLKDAVKLATDGDLTKNPAGRAYLLGKALSFELTLPNMGSGMTTRGEAGFVDNPTAPYDLVIGMDSAFKVVEAAQPSCLSMTVQYRQQKPWIDLVNGAIAAGNTGHADSAVAMAKRSLVFSTHTPYGFMVLANDAANKNQTKEAIAYFKSAIGAATDTAQADVRRQMLSQLGNVAAQAASAATGDDKQTFVTEAKSAYEELQKDPGKYADLVTQGLGRLAVASGDSGAIKSSYSKQLENPSAYSYSVLLNSAITASNAHQDGDAIKLAEAARAANPNHRDVLYALGRLYFTDSAYTKSVPLARQLTANDPLNPDNFQLLAASYNGISKTYTAQQKAYEAKAAALGKRANTTKGAAQKAAIDSAARIDPLIRAYADSAKVMLDSTIKYSEMIAKVPARVTFTEFTPTESKATLSGSISNQTDAQQSYTLQIQFLDKAGNVVDTQPVSAPNVASHQAARFSAAGNGAGIVAFKYSTSGQ